MKLETLILNELNTEKTLMQLVNAKNIPNWYGIIVLNKYLNSLIDKKLIKKFDVNRIQNTYKKI